MKINMNSCHYRRNLNEDQLVIGFYRRVFSKHFMTESKKFIVLIFLSYWITVSILNVFLERLLFNWWQKRTININDHDLPELDRVNSNIWKSILLSASLMLDRCWFFQRPKSRFIWIEKNSWNRWSGLTFRTTPWYKPCWESDIFNRRANRLIDRLNMADPVK